MSLKAFIIVFSISLINLSQSKLLDLDDLYNSDLELYSKVYNATMEWGTYKPNQFFGIKNREEHPILIGLAWAIPDAKTRSFKVRHIYKYQSDENISAYYEYHDGWSSSR